MCCIIVGCFYSNALGGLKCYENPKHKVTAVPADEEEICGATFKVKKEMTFVLGERKKIMNASSKENHESVLQF